jgi:predicted signal transduction protein with EAL and GGDEF domain
MGLVVCAEGVESEAAIDLLAGLRCDLGQGFCISRPLPAGAFAEWLARQEQGFAGIPAAPQRAAGIVIGEGGALVARG